jgi:4-alpha-glucanotransferase
MTAATAVQSVRALARESGVQLSYLDIDGHRVSARTDALVAVLSALGVIDRAADAGDALRQKRSASDTRMIAPVAVAWDGVAALELQVPSHDVCEHADVVIEGEDGEHVELAPTLRPVRATEADGRGRVVLQYVIDVALPAGTHRLHVRAGRSCGDAHVIVAPTRCWGVPRRTWGLFTPTYSLRDGPDLGAGHLGHLARLGDWLADHGGSFLATLPLLPVYLGTPFDPSPYAPVSRRHWNEALLDPTDLHDVPAPDATPPPSPLVDWRAVGQASRQLLTKAVSNLAPARAAELDAFLACHPDVVRYARFRAAVEKTGQPPRESSSIDAAVERRHAYGQWQARMQVAAMVQRLEARGVGLVLDLPVGTHPMGYDVWDAQHEYVPAVSVGAPPDGFFPQGQRWGFPPTRPLAGAADGFARLRACLAHHMAPAAALRIDHVMSLHRLFWVPDGFEARDGVYVRYPAEAQWAMVSAASHRHECRVIGEDLGTVPAEVRAALARHRALRTWVGQFGLTPEAPIPAPPRRCVASFSTHDTPTLTAWWTGEDIAQRLDLGLLDRAEARRAGEQREALRAAVADALGVAPIDPRRARCALLGALGATPAELTLVALDDLWGETQPQNVPGTGSEVPNWRRRHARSMHDLGRDPDFGAVLEPIARSRSAP